MHKLSILAGVFGVCFSSGGALGATISTSLIRQPSGDRLECRVVNVGRTSMQMTAEGVGPDGKVFSSHSARVDAGHEGPSAIGICNAPSGEFCAAYCRFTAESKKSMRGSAAAVSASTQEATATLPAL